VRFALHSQKAARPTRRGPRCKRSPSASWARLYTNMPDAYPVSGTKPISVTPWFEQVVLDKKMFVMNTIGEISQHFFDHGLIASLGCGSCVNLPVLVQERALGTMNMLNPEGYFTPEKLALVEHLQVPAMAAFLAAGEAATP
jgi:hypothetical protein